jgi:hypothetical protein
MHKFNWQDRYFLFHSLSLSTSKCPPPRTLLVLSYADILPYIDIRRQKIVEGMFGDGESGSTVIVEKK